MKSPAAPRLFATLALVRRLLFVAIFACSLAMLWANESLAAISYTAAGASYTQDFDSLPNTSSASTGILQGTGTGQYTNGWADDTTTVAGDHFSIPGWYLYHSLDPSGTEDGTNSHQRVRWGTGSGNTGAFYSFGVAGTNAVTDRSLGNLTSNTIGTSYYGVRLTNNTGVTLDQFTLNFTAEQWRDGGATSPAVSLAQSVTFDYGVTSTAPANLGALTGTPVGAFGFTSPQFGRTTAVALDGNAAANRVVISPTTVQGINWAPGQDLWLRWTDIDHSGNDHGLGIDDLTFSANIIPTSTWSGAANSDWNNASNWTGGVPASGNIANFDNA